MSVATGAEARSDSASRGHGRRTIVLVAVLAVALTSAGVAGWRWWTHPSIFTSLGDSYRSDPLPLADAALSTTVVFPKVHGSGEEVWIDDLDASFSSNTADADATFWVCHMTAGEDPIGAVHDPRSACSDIQAFEPPMRFDYGVAPDSDYLFVTIAPTRSGVAHLTTVDIDYQRSSDHLYQRGTQTVRVDRKITVR